MDKNIENNDQYTIEQRSNRIIELVGSGRIKSHGDIIKILIKGGKHISQSTVSRDLKRLKISKPKGSEVYRLGDAIEKAILKRNYLAC